MLSPIVHVVSWNRNHYLFFIRFDSIAFEKSGSEMNSLWPRQNHQLASKLQSLKVTMETQHKGSKMKEIIVVGLNSFCYSILWVCQVILQATVCFRVYAHCLFWTERINRWSCTFQLKNASDCMILIDNLKGKCV